MKDKIQYLLLAAVILTVIISCTSNEWEEIQDIKAGYAAFSDSSAYEVIVMKDPALDTVIYETVNIHLEFQFFTAITSFEKMGIKKAIYDESDHLVAVTEILSSNTFADTLAIDITGVDMLFSGLNFIPGSINSGYYFEFSSFIVLSPGDTIVSSYGNFYVEPEYINFCTLPDIPLGTWEAHNAETGFKKDVQILYLEVMKDVWFLVITDFGLDWSTWDDHWYGTNFYLDCPLPGMTQFKIDMAVWGIDQPEIILEMDNDDGVPESRPLRIMPWNYGPDSPDIGYYDAVNKQLVFKDVYMIDTWWGIDNYLLKQVTFTYKGED